MDSHLGSAIQSLTSAIEMQETTMMMMQPSASWEQYLTPAPLSILIIAELVFISSGADFSINKNPPPNGFNYLKYPESFRDSIMQIVNSGWHAFNMTHNNMNRIHNLTAKVPEVASKIILHKNDNVETLLQDIRSIADECATLATDIEKKYSSVINLIQETLEACINTRSFQGEELKTMERKLSEDKIRADDAKEWNEFYKSEIMSLSKQFQEAHKELNKLMNSLPSDWKIIWMDLVDELAVIVTEMFKKYFLFPASNPQPVRRKSGEFASQRVAENVRYRIERRQDQIKQGREFYDKYTQYMQKNRKELTEILVKMQNLNNTKIGLDTTIKILVRSLNAMLDIKRQWEKMVPFFQMVSNFVHSSLSEVLHEFLKTDDTRKLTKYLVYGQVFKASIIASLVHTISGTYTEVSDKYLMDKVGSLRNLISMDKSKPEFKKELQKLQQSCNDSQELILQLVLENKEVFQKMSRARLEILEDALGAILRVAQQNTEDGFDEEDHSNLGLDKTQKTEL